MKRIISILLILSICLGMGLAAQATDGNESVFEDVQEKDWYYEAVSWAVAENITQGMSSSNFGAMNTVTRAMMVTFIWRMAGTPAPTTVRGFADVPDGMWYSDAVNWAAEQGIANGISATAFDPDGEMTREQAVTFLYREEQRTGGGFTGVWAYPMDYSDVGQISDWAFEPFCWMNMKGVIQGYNGNLMPKGLCTRAEVVTMLYRYANEIKGATSLLDFTERAVPVLRDSLDSKETATLRFYVDMPDVPYMEIRDYYNTFYLIGTDRTDGLTEAWVPKTNSRCLLTNLGGYSAEVDIDADTITAYDLSAFTTSAYYLQLELDDENDNNYPFLQYNDITLEPENPTPITLRLGDYGIDIRGGRDGLYLPLGTLSDIYGTTETIYTVYNGEKIYAVDYQGKFQPDSALTMDDDFAAPFAALRAADLADFTYRELCFNIDYFYGKPGQEYIHEALTYAGLDAILTQLYPDIKTKLLSSDFSEFFSGLNLLIHGLLFDGGHTAIISRIMEDDEELISNALQELLQEDYSVSFIIAMFKEIVRANADYSRETVYNGDYYVEYGDTAMIRLDEFTVDTPAWKAFYAGGGEMPFEGDTLGTIYAGLKRAAANPSIKNVVIDITCNGGGDSAAMNAIEWLMTGEGSIRYENRLTGQVTIAGSTLDANFDGVFDANDRPFTQFRYGVLTSTYSFSCGNAFPFFMREHGAMILGEQSSGGACAIRISTAGGVEFGSSAATSIIVTEAGESVDYGCPVDVELSSTPDVDMETGEILSDAQMYDLVLISSAMNGFFGSAEQDPTA